MPQRPNIFYIHSHDTGRYVSPYGHAVRTPHLHRFAQQGVLFRQAFCANPTCSPSRASLLSGTWAHCNGMLGLAHRGWRMTDYRQHLARMLKAQGYRTALCGVQHETKHARVQDDLGYDELLQAGSDADARADAVATRLRSHNAWAGDDQQPLFMSIGFFETHRNFPAHDPEDDPRYLAPPAPLPDTPRTRQDMADYATMVHRLDAAIGRVLAAVDDAQIADHTLVIITTDHGIAFPRMKCNLTDHGIGVMLMMRGPAASGFCGGKVVDAMVSQVDIVPTLFDLLGWEAPAHVRGRSFLPVVRGEADAQSPTAVRDEVFAEVNYHAAYEPMRAVRTPRYKLIRRYGRRGRPVLPNCDDSTSKDVLLEAGWRDMPLPDEELFDLLRDPHEAANVAADPTCVEALADLRGRLDRWMLDTDDPLLAGDIPPVKGAVLNDPDQTSPRDPTTTA
jgi:N-sulfoglucosamine sulfohydrolase